MYELLIWLSIVPKRRLDMNLHSHIPCGASSPAWGTKSKVLMPKSPLKQPSN